MHKPYSIIIWIIVIALCIWLAVTSIFFFRLDLTEEKRYTLSNNTKELLDTIQQPIEVELYLNGPLDANMAQLRNAFIEMVQEYNIYANKRLTIKNINPSEGSTDEERNNRYMELENEGLTGMSVSMQDNDGRLSQQIVFPWAVFTEGDKAVAMALIQPSSQQNAQQSIKSAIEDLEYQMTDAIRILNRKDTKKIAYIEGHKELNEWETYDVNEAFSRYFQVDRGLLGDDPEVLMPYEAIIIAGPMEPYSEADKYIIDQYIMNGGKVLWLVDGVRISEQELSESGASPAMALDVNLSDMLFKYGVRITPTIISDLQCTYMPINIAKIGETPRFEPMPYFYSPLLLTSPYHPITKNLMPVKANFASGVELINSDPLVKKEYLLISSNASHITMAPNNILLNEVLNIDPQTYFNTGNIPVGVVMEGNFPSVFTHRMTPQGIIPGPTKEISEKTRMVVIGDADIMRNDMERQDGGYRILPAGFDRISRQTYGNKDFILNSLLYLTDENGLMQLRNRQMPLRLLNNAAIVTHRRFWQVVCVGGPLLLLGIFAVVFLLIRKKKYSKPIKENE